MQQQIQSKKSFETSSMQLHIMAMIFMLCDHLWATIVPGNDWLTCIGRIAFPLFAFMIVEGYFHTSNLKKYIQRLVIFAIISEIPFNLVMGNSLFYPLHQNVLWTFLLGILLIHLNEKAKKTGKIIIRVLTVIATVILAYLLGIITFVDFYNAGVLTVLVFYFFRGRKWYNFIAQLALLAYINIEMLSGLVYEISLFGITFSIVRQGFALLALIPIWLYKGKQGPYNKILKYTYYGFYPAHLLVLYLLMLL